MAAREPQVVDAEEFIPICDYQFQGDSRTVENKRIFVEWYRRKASIFHAAQAARIARSTVYRWMEEDVRFVQAMEDSFEDAADIAESSVYERAIGRDCKPDSLLAMFWLKAHRPKYRDRVSIDVDSLREEIQERMTQAGINDLRQLPPVMAEMIDTTISMQSVQSLQLPHQPAQIQKEDSSSSSSD